MAQSLTRALGAFVAGLRLPAVPPEALAVVHTGFADLGQCSSSCLYAVWKISSTATSSSARFCLYSTRRKLRLPLREAFRNSMDLEVRNVELGMWNLEWNAKVRLPISHSALRTPYSACRVPHIIAQT